MKKNMIDNLKKNFNKIRPAPISNAKSMKMSMDIAQNYLNRAYCPTGRNTTGGMLRGSTLHLKSFEQN